MKNYAEQVVFTKKSLELFKAARMIVNHIQNHNGRYRDDREHWIRCHEVARIVATVLKNQYKLTVVDGKYGSPGIEHSWLIYDECNSPIPELSYKCILDTYAIARSPMVQLVDPYPGHYLMYEPGKVRKDINVKFVRAEVARARQRGFWRHA